MKQLGSFGGNKLGLRSRDSLATELAPTNAMFGVGQQQAIPVPVRSHKPVSLRTMKARQRRSWLAPSPPMRLPNRDAPPEAQLLYVSPLGGSTVFVLKPGVTRIGRKEDNDIVLADAKISKRHATIELNSRRGHCGASEAGTSAAASNEKTSNADDEYDNDEGPDFEFILKDNNSSNGVRLNDAYLTMPAQLRHGDSIQIGAIVLMFQELLLLDEDNANPKQGQPRTPAPTHIPGYAPATDKTVHEGKIYNLEGGGQSDVHALQAVRDSEMSPVGRLRNEELNQDAGNTPSTRRNVGSVISSPTASVSGQNQMNDILKGLVTILPSEKKYEETVSIRAELDEPTDNDFPPVDEIKDIDTLKQDYEKLRLAYELSKFSSVTSNVNEHLTRMLDIMFSVLPVDRGVVLLVDNATALLVTSMVKVREGKGYEDREIMLSSTILQRVYNTRKCLITSDACEDPDLGKSFSIARGQIRSVICVPILAHDEVLGILHLDSRDRINAFIEKDLALVKTIINQTAVQIENSVMFNQKQTEIRVSEQLKRFLPPQVVDRMVKKEEVIHRGGREITGTIVFADIRGFTNLSERSTPAEVFDLLNDYFERLVNIVFKYNGVVDKFIGDELMAIFGTLDDASADVTPSVLNSVLAAIEFMHAVEEMNADRKSFGQDPIAIGVGLNTGRLMAGFMGSSERLEYTCIGDTVNLASRICGGAAAGQVLISEATMRYVQGRIETKYVGSRKFKGKNEETRLYEAIGLYPDDHPEYKSNESLC